VVFSLDLNLQIILLTLLRGNIFQICDTKSLLAYLLSSFVVACLRFVSTKYDIFCLLLLDLLIGH
jgi:hypothetical protein